jgi:hypothetical protein
MISSPATARARPADTKRLLAPDSRPALLRAALGFLQLEPREPELHLLHCWLDTWSGVGLVATGMQRQGWDLQAHGLRRWPLAGDLLRDGPGALGRGRVGVGSGAVGGGATGGEDDHQNL